MRSMTLDDVGAARRQLDGRRTAHSAQRSVAGLLATLLVVAGLVAIRPGSSASAAAPPQSSQGYWLAAADGGVFSFGNAAFHGSEAGTRLAAPIVGIAATPDGGGYWLVASDGGVFAFGDAGFYGSMGGNRLAAPVVGIAATPDGRGYWLVGRDGGVFAFGDAAFHGSEGGARLAASIVGAASDPDGGGSWLLGEDGGIFSFGDAPFYGSATEAIAQGVAIGITGPPAGGYVLATSRNAVIAYGPPGVYANHGGPSGQLNASLVGLSFARNGVGGYWLTAGDGGVFALGDTAFFGSAAGIPLAAPVVGIASVGQGPP